MAELKPGCVTPAKGPIGGSDPAPTATETNKEAKPRMGVMVGKPAPDFEANGYQDGTFQTFKLSDYRGKWVVLCFYPGDFTFV
ncbi:MAG: redoxin domain-containing protein [Coriobacteriia bacterium]|nr:redoxin domain-containing protein [Coriobacteriia bacterium]MBN2822553.1 redoxin domain-containing protein [Coriobacteriia bacterium]